MATPFVAKVETRQLTEKIKSGRFGGIIGRAPDMLAIAEGGTVFLDEIGDLAGETVPGSEGDSAHRKHKTNSHQCTNIGSNQS